MEVRRVQIWVWSENNGSLSNELGEDCWEMGRTLSRRFGRGMKSYKTNNNKKKQQSCSALWLIGWKSWGRLAAIKNKWWMSPGEKHQDEFGWSCWVKHERFQIKQSFDETSSVSQEERVCHVARSCYQVSSEAKYTQTHTPQFTLWRMQLVSISRITIHLTAFSFSQIHAIWQGPLWACNWSLGMTFTRLVPLLIDPW